jgi:hypothetical protein
MKEALLLLLLLHIEKVVHSNHPPSTKKSMATGPTGYEFILAFFRRSATSRKTCLFQGIPRSWSNVVLNASRWLSLSFSITNASTTSPHTSHITHHTSHITHHTLSKPTTTPPQRKVCKSVCFQYIFIMPPISRIGMALMPISQGIAWYLVLRTTGSSRTNTISPALPTLTILYTHVSYIAAFYCAWALYNRYWGGNVRELGQYSMGLVTVATYCQNYPFTMVATILVVCNFVLPSYFILWKWNATEVARNIKQDTSALGILWARIFQWYFVSNIALWCTIVYKFYQYHTLSLLHHRDYHEVPTTSVVV